jgi:3-hydroxyisobutyrate dehydrogenase-like beta-hydroxyacid dehydrogenase
MKVTFIGLGIMGSRMAHNLLKGKTDLTVYNRTRSAAHELEKHGANVTESAIEAVTEADIVITMLSTPEVVQEVAFGEKGFVQSMKKGALWMDCSTVNPSFSAQTGELAEAAGIEFVASPVAGSKDQAANAQLVFFAGGKAENVEKVKPLVKLMGKKIMHLGDHAKGSALKMLVNGMLAQSMLIFAEAVSLGENMGLEKDFLLNFLPNLPVIAPFTQHKVAAMSEGNYTPSFPLEWMHKDVHLMTQTAYEHNTPLFLANATKEVFAAAKASGLGREDFSAVYEYLREKF